VCLPDVVANASVYYQQISFLAAHEYRIIALSLPSLFEPLQLVHALDMFVEEVLKLKKFHLLGSGMGGYLALLFCQTRPHKLVSLFVVNVFCDLEFQKGLFPSTTFMPGFLLAASLVEGLPRAERVHPENCMAGLYIERLISDYSLLQLSARVALLHCSETALSPLTLRQRFASDHCITIFETLDESKLSESQKAQIAKYFPEALIAHVKQGGTFPYLAHPDDFNMHLLVHLRRNDTPKEQ
jgi:maspardin